MPGRTFAAQTPYRYGFNGKEKDKDAGEGIQDYGMRISDNRLGRFLSEDPITKKYPELTPYQFASNRPIDGIDLDGLEFCRFDLDSYDPNVKEMAKMDNVSNFRDSKNYQIFSQRRNGIVLGSLSCVVGGVTYKTLNTVVTFLFTAELAGSIHHNKSKTQEQEKERKKHLNQTIANTATGIGIGKALGTTIKFLKATAGKFYTITETMTLSQKIAVREELARNFLKASQVKEIDRHIEAMFMAEKVTVTTYKPGSVFYRYSEIGTKNPKHYYFTDDPSLVSPMQLGKASMYKDPKKYVLEKFTITTEIKGLNSTVNLNGTKGATQVMSTEIENNAVKEVSKTF